MPNLSPNAAAKECGYSRRSIMRAIETGKLSAWRDNRNCWQIDAESLAQWALSEHAQPSAQPTPTPETAVLEEKIRGLESLLAEMRRERDELRLDRDAWRSLAQKPWWKKLAG